MELIECCVVVLTVCAAICTAAYWCEAASNEALAKYRLQRNKGLDRKEAEHKEKGFE
jgi:hypothetical protein